MSGEEWYLHNPKANEMWPPGLQGHLCPGRTKWRTRIHLRSEEFTRHGGEGEGMEPVQVTEGFKQESDAASSVYLSRRQKGQGGDPLQSDFNSN